MTSRKERVEQLRARLNAEQRARVERVLEGTNVSPSDVSAASAIKVNPAQRHEPFPLTELQEAYWVGRSSGMTLGNLACFVYFETESSDLDPARLQAALQRLIARHDMLRMIISKDGKQQILPNVPLYEIPVRDLRGIADREARLAEIRHELSHQVLPTDRWPLFSMTLSRLDDRTYRLHVGFDTLVGDAWGLRIALTDLQKWYENPDLALPEISLSFRDYVVAEVADRQGPAYARALAYWQERLKTLAPPPALPLTKQPEEITQPRFERRLLQLPLAQAQRLRTHATNHGLTMTQALIAVYAEVLGRFSSSKRFTINIPLFNRLPLHPEVNQIVGEFASFTLLEVDQTQRAPFGERAVRLKEQFTLGLDHSRVHGVRLLRELNRIRGRRELMPVVFTSIMSLEGLAPPSMSKEAFGKLLYEITQTPQVWLDLQVFEDPDALRIQLDAIADLFPEGMLDALLTGLSRLLTVLAESKEAWDYETFEIVTVPPTTPMLPEASGKTLAHQGFCQQMAARPDAPAVIAPTGPISYREIQQSARHVRDLLRQQGIVPGQPIAVVMEKGWEQVSAVLGILLAGAAYVPIDASSPTERRDVILHQVGAKIILTQPHLVERTVWPANSILLTFGKDALYAAGEGADLGPATENDLAYVLFTSGSTGTPKGAMIEHFGVAQAIFATNSHFNLGPKDRVLGLTALHHDMSVYDVLGMTAAGGAVVLPAPEEMRDPGRWVELIREHDITVWNSVPAFMEMLLEYLESRPDLRLPSLRRVFLGGDFIAIDLPERLRRVAPSAKLVSVGGPTETTLWNIWYEVEQIDPSWKSIPYGKPISGVRYLVLDESLEACPVGVPGELCCSGVGLARGYWGDKPMTNERFVVFPASGERIYRTGDLGRFKADGQIEILGRTDFQVKILGHRVETGEIEACLLRHPKVRSAVVVGHGPAGRQKLAAYWIPQNNAARPTSDELRQHLANSLPTHMVPTTFTMLEQMPLSANGKVDRRALSAAHPTPETSPTSGSSARVPEIDSTLTTITEIAASLLGVASLEPDIDLMAAGVDSVTLVRLANQIETRFGYRPPAADLFRAPSVRSIARLLQSGTKAAVPAPTTALHTTGAPRYEMITDPAERKIFREKQLGIRPDQGESAISLPHDVNEELRERFAARRSQRRFALRLVPQRALSSLLGHLRQLTIDGAPKYFYPSGGGLYGVQVYLHAKPGRIEKLAGGIYYYHPVRHELVALTSGAEIERDIHVPFINQPIYDEAAFSLFFIAQLEAIGPLYGDFSVHHATLETGIMSQLLDAEAPKLGIGLCHIGHIEFDGVRAHFRLDHTHVLVHSMLGGSLETNVNLGAANKIAVTPVERVERLREQVQQLTLEEVEELLVARRGAEQQSTSTDRNLDISLLALKQERLLALLLEEEKLETIVPIRRCDRQNDIAPLAFVQEQLWLIDQLNPGDPAYNVSVHLELSGDLNFDALQNSLSKLVERHEPLRTAFEESAGRPQQRIQPPRPVMLTILDLRGVSPQDLGPMIEKLARDEGRRAFDLRRGYFLRATILQTSATQNILLLTLHHIVFDVWSTGPLLRELFILYQSERGREAPALPSPDLQYRDFIEWQRMRLDSQRLAGLRTFWRQYLANSPPLLMLPTDRPRPTRQTFHGARVLFRIPKTQTTALRALGRSADASLFMTTLSIFALLLSRYTGQTDVVIGSPAGNRHRTEFESLIGFFVDVVALRAAINPEASFLHLLSTTRQSVLSAFEHQDMPFSLLVETLKVPRDLSHNPIFQVSFALISQSPSFPSLGDLEMRLRENDNRTAKFDMTLDFFEDGQGLNGSIEYNTDLFDETTIHRLAKHYQTLVDSILTDAQGPVGKLRILPEEEKRTLLDLWNPTTPLVSDQCIHTQIAEFAQKNPNAPALTVGTETLTHAVLSERVRTLAHELRILGIGPDVLVGVHLPRSMQLVIAVLAVLEAGGAYVPLDPNYPRERTALIVEDAALRVIITNQHLASGLAHPHLLLIDAERAIPTSPQSATVDIPTLPHHLAYVLYTSGSTGRPQGVQVEHRNVSSFFVAMDQLLGLPQNGVWLAVTSLSFDISVLEILWTLSRGVHVVLQRELSLSAPASRTRKNRQVDLSLFFFAASVDESRGEPDDLYDLLRQCVKRADELGFAAVFVPERHFHEFGGPYPSPSVIGAALSAITSKIQIRAGSVVIPLQDPIRVAEEWATLDHLSHGRVGLAFASGWHADDFVLAPEDYADRRAAMLSGIETVQRLWRGETIRRKNGVGREIDVRIYPTPVQSAIPIWLTAAGNVTTFQEAGKRGYRVLTHLLGQSIAELGEKIAAYRQAYREAGHVGEGYVTLMVHYFLGRDLKDVHRRVRRPFLNYLRSSVDLTARLADQHGLDARKLSPDDINALLEHGYDRYVEKSALIGTPDSCRALFEQLCELGVDEMAGLVDFGLPTEDVLNSLELFSELRDGKSNWDTHDESFAAQIVRHGVTHLQCTPSLARLLLDDSHTRAALGRLREFLVGGEELPLPLAKELADVVPGAVRNMYGPTETTVWSSSFQVSAGCPAVRIGSPLANSRIYVVDANGQLAPIGVIGEIIIGGTAVTRGYHQRPDLTAQRFIDDPFVPGARAYRTGDLGRMRTDGTLEFLGRRDSQIKLRGHRIELGDIEAALRKFPGVLEAATTVHPDAAGEPRLCAYVVPAMANMDQLAPQATTEHLSTWQTLWERTYSEPRKDVDDGRFWTAGWISSLTGELIDAAAMQDWVENTVARIRAYHPKRVLEIGCGSGLLLFNIAPHCDHYIAQDFSRAVLDHVRDEAQRHNLHQITLVEAPADTLEHVPRESVDMVVVNSVIQYFPSTDYLVHVLEQAAMRVRDGGHIFVGDVRDARLLRAQLATTLVHRASQDNPNVSARTLHRELERRVAEEEELLLEPAFFAALKTRIPRIKSLRILRKIARFDTEMARFRYDVILDIGSSENTPASKTERPWGDLTLESLRPLLSSLDDAPFVIRDVPDARLASPVHLALMLGNNDLHDTSVQKLQSASLTVEAIDMEKVRAIAMEYGLTMTVSPSLSGAEALSDIVFWQSASIRTAGSWDDLAPTQPLSSFANNPLRAKQMRTLVPLIREYLRDQLPDYMLPSAFILLDALPRTPNGKIARRVLPPPEQATGQRKREHVPPQTPTEIKLAEVWTRVLNVDRLSAEDNFFDLGGHSFSAAQLVFYIRETFHRELPLGALFAAPTLSAMARAIDSKPN